MDTPHRSAATPAGRLKRGDAVRQNSAGREKPEENAKSAHEAAEMMRLPVTSVRAAGKVQKHGVEAVAAAKMANSTSASGDCPQIEKGCPPYISVTFAWIDRPVSLSTSGGSIKVETVNGIWLVLERIRQIF